MKNHWRCLSLPKENKSKAICTVNTNVTSAVLATF
jgi:hypothetical protein